MKMSNTIKVFSSESPELYISFKDYFDHTRAIRGVKGKVFSETSLETKDAVITKLFAKEVAEKSRVSVEDYSGSYARYGNNPMVKSFADAIVDNMINMILPEVLIGSMGLISEIRFGGWFDSFKFTLGNNGLFNVAKAGYRQKTAPAQRLEKTTVTLTPINHEVTVTTNLPNILAGRDSIAEYVMKVVRSIEAAMLYETYDAFTEAVEAATVPSGLKVTNYTERELIRVCETVTAWNGGNKAVIAGTPIALKGILPSSISSRILLDDDYVKVGHLERFNGYDIFPMSQVADYQSRNYGMKLKDDKVYIVSPSSDKIIKVAVGETLSHTDDTFANENLAVEGTITKAWEVACITNSLAGVITSPTGN